jgi:hypothetical protein
VAIVEFFFKKKKKNRDKVERLLIFMFTLKNSIFRHECPLAAIMELHQRLLQGWPLALLDQAG